MENLINCNIDRSFLLSPEYGINRNGNVKTRETLVERNGRKRGTSTSSFYKCDPKKIRLSADEAVETSGIHADRIVFLK